MAPRTEVMEMVTDVLVLGGGPAATWAGVAAAESGASVILWARVCRDKRRNGAGQYRHMVASVG